MNKGKKDIWILVDHTGDTVDETTFGLIAEAGRIISDAGGEGSVTAVIMGPLGHDAVTSIKNSSADRIIHIKHELLGNYHGEVFARVFYEAVKGNDISCIILSQKDGASDFAPRLAAMMNTALVTRAMDFRFDEKGRGLALRPVSNGYLFDEIMVDTANPPVVVFLPSVLSDIGDHKDNINITVDEIFPDIDETLLNTKIVNIINADPGDLSIEDADMVVAGGRGAGKGDAFDIIHELAGEIGASVGGTRPVIDNRLLPFERQIGQTGKTVSPGLIINCGISGANEYSAGMEKSKNVISINKDPRARIFRFSDLGVVGDIREIVPLLIERIKEIKKKEE